MKYTEEIDAEVVVTARLAGGRLEARASATCEYEPGRTASAEVVLPEQQAKAIRSAMDAGLAAMEAELGRRLSRSRHEAQRIGASLGEHAGAKPAKGKVSSATKARRS